MNASTPALYEVTRPTLQVAAGIACVTALISAVIKALLAIRHGSPYGRIRVQRSLGGLARHGDRGLQLVERQQSGAEHTRSRAVPREADPRAAAETRNRVGARHPLRGLEQ